MNCVYAFYFKDTQECAYVGSTKEFWCRYGKHLVDSVGYKQQFKLYQLIKQRGGWENIEYRILEKDIDSDKLLYREKHHYLELKPLGNRQSPFQTEQERAAQIKQKNKDKKLKKTVCVCGSIVSDYPSAIEKHILTSKHQSWCN